MFPPKDPGETIGQICKGRASEETTLACAAVSTAYQADRSVETALHRLVYRLEDARNKNCIAVGLFLDIEGAFNCTTVESICRAAERHGLGATIIRWISNMLSTRLLTVSRGKGTVKASVGRGCPQGGVISQLLGCL